MKNNNNNSYDKKDELSRLWFMLFQSALIGIPIALIAGYIMNTHILN